MCVWLVVDNVLHLPLVIEVKISNSPMLTKGLYDLVSLCVCFIAFSVTYTVAIQ